MKPKITKEIKEIMHNERVKNGAKGGYFIKNKYPDDYYSRIRKGEKNIPPVDKNEMLPESLPDKDN